MGSLCLVLVLLHLSWSSSSSVPSPSPHLCLPDQKSALLQFKNSNFPSKYCWFKLDSASWNNSIDCCSWQGVECNNVTGNVIGIDLSHRCVDASLTEIDTLGHLHSLQWLDLSSNELFGSLLENTSSSLFHFRALRQLDLAYNYVDGAISPELFSQLASLTHLNLSSNWIDGLIPNQISLLSRLVSLDLSQNYYGLSFEALGFDMLARNLTRLRTLVLDSVDMSDVSLTSFLNLSSSLERLSLRDCRLNGEFPTRLFRLPNLKHIDLTGNGNLTGYLPNTNWSSGLELLNLSYCGFRGSIPASFGNLARIVSIDLSGNWFEGRIPDVFGNLGKLASLRFSSCNLSGPLPITLFNLTQITTLDLSDNHLEGPLPNHVGELRLLKELVLSNNAISGGVPSWLLTLSSLLVLDLGYNRLASPMERIQMPTSIQHVDLSSNHFDGPIPDSFFDLANLTSLHLSSNNLSGVVNSDMLSKLTSLEVLDLSNNSLLSLSAGDNDVNHSFPHLETVLFSSCSVRRFPSFFRASQLVVLDLSNNMISGRISKWEAEGWETLHVLNLSYNFLTTLEQFPGGMLTILDLRSNMLEGPILSTWLNLQYPQWLTVFLIAKNKLTGNVPSSICNFSSLTILDMSKNSLSGTILECLGNFSSSIKFMDLQVNNLHGKIPDSFENNDLSHLFLNNNQLEGLIPPSLANSTSLEVLNLGNNKLTGRFPHRFASLPSLQVLILRCNRFHGSLPDSVESANFSTLRIIDLSGNEFSGTLPTKLFRNLRAMTVAPKERRALYPTTYLFGGIGYDVEYYQTSLNVTTKRLEMELTKTVAIFVSMDLSNNQFCGQIPEDVGRLVSLQMLNFSRNNFTGPIPASFGNLVALESLDLSSNKLSGTIPYQMTKLTFLAVLNLSENDLVGPIPHGNQFDTFDNDSYGGNLELCGLPLSKQCNNHAEAEPPAPRVAEHDDSQVPFFWQAVMMGYGSGVVLGLSVGYIVFKTGKPWWLVRIIERDLQYRFTNWIRRNKPRRN